MATAALILDQYSQLGHKVGMDPLDKSTPLDVYKTEGWLGADPQTIRRLQAYTRLDAYRKNQARHFLRTNDPAEKLAHREYGDAEVLIERIAAAILGDDPELRLDGLIESVPNIPPLPDRPSPTPTGDPEIDSQVGDLLDTLWRERAVEALEQWQADLAALPALTGRQEWLDAWADEEQIWSKLRYNESETVGLGDGVLVLGFDYDKADPVDPTVAGRPTLTVYDADSYHPILSDTPGDTYPSVVHFSWKLADPADPDVTLVRRITYWLAPTGQPAVPLTAESRQTGAAQTYAYSEQPSQVACYMSDITWPEKSLSKEDTIFTLPWATVSAGGVPEQVRDSAGLIVPAVAVETGYDFLPIVHIPNTETGAHFGVSSLSRVLQLLDDIAQGDASRTQAAWLAGNPPVGVTGVSNTSTVDLVPGLVVGLGENGRLDPLDTTGAVAALSDFIDRLLKRLTINIQIPDGLLGRVDAAEVPSGLALALSFTPFVQLVELLRLIRDHKYRLLVKMVQRIAIAAGTLEGPVHRGGVQFGSFMPQDQAFAVDSAVKLVNAHAMPRQQVLRMLEAAGFEVGDIEDAISAISAEDFEGAKFMADAFDGQHPQLVADYLGRDLPEPTEETAPPAPAAVPGGPAAGVPVVVPAGPAPRFQ